MTASVEAARALLHGLLGAGVRDVVLCPGSRSAPLSYAAQSAELAGAVRLHVRSDERTAAFVALGCGLADPAHPAVVVTTSGTAVANLHPAVLEAHHAGVPLLVVTADRPHRLRGTWANQTSDLQAGLFGPAPVATLDLAVDDSHDWAAVAADLVRAARGGAEGGGRTRGGPVHLNLGFDDPLAPDALKPWGAGPSLSEPGDPERPPEPAPTVVLERGPRTLVVAGDGAGAAARRLAEEAGWPLLAEPSSGAAGGRSRVGAYRLLLDQPGFGDRVERVVVLGRPTLSRQVTRLLDRGDVEMVQGVRFEQDPGPRRPVRRVTGEVRAAGAPDGDVAWLRRWLGAGRAAERAVDDVLDGWPSITGPLLAREVARACEPGSALVVAASNPVRDLDLVTPPRGGVLVLSNRGLSGIDGTLGTATGVAVASGRATRLLVGDLALLHDLGALVLPASERKGLRLQVVVLNDDGGGIFGLLEHGDHPSSFERVFGTPHGADLTHLCAGLGVPFARADDQRTLAAALAGVPAGVSVLEVSADRSDLRPLHAALAAAVGAAVSVDRPVTGPQHRAGTPQEDHGR